jgi:hypothetical protein
MTIAGESTARERESQLRIRRGWCSSVVPMSKLHDHRADNLLDYWS